MFKFMILNEMFESAIVDNFDPILQCRQIKSLSTLAQNQAQLSKPRQQPYISQHSSDIETEKREKSFQWCTSRCIAYDESFTYPSQRGCNVIRTARKNLCRISRWNALHYTRT